MTLSKLPKDWVSVPISELLKKKWLVDHMDGNHGSDYPRSDEFIDSGVPYIAANSIQSGKVNFRLAKFLSVERAGQLRKGFAQDGDVLFAHNATVGPVALLRTPHQKVILGTSLTYYRCNPKYIEPLYLKCYLESHWFVSQYKRMMGQSTRNQVPITAQREFTCILPPLPEQQKIAAILSTWDRAIELTEKLIAAKQKRKQAFMQQLLTGKVRLPGFTEDWKSIRAGDLFKPISKKNHGDERVLSVTQDMGVVYRDELERKIGMNMDNTGGYKLVEPGNFVISLRSFQGGLEMSRLRGIVSPAYHVIRPAMTIDQEFFRHYFKSYEFIGRLSVAVIGIRDGKQISFEDFSFMKFHIPSVKEQSAIGTILNVAEKELATLNRKAAALKHQKKGLMQQLLTGKKRVAVGEINE